MKTDHHQAIMSSFKGIIEEIERKVPGYRVVDFRSPKQGEFYWADSINKVEQISFGTCATLVFILEKVHQPPEIVKVLFRGDLHDVSGDHAWKPTERMSFHSSYDGDTRNVTGNYDAMIAVNLDGSETIALGHWNDGIQGEE